MEVSMSEINMSIGTRYPQIVITGDKNTGKSSLVASICGVPVPGSTSIVTKWQMSNGPWSASVYILWDDSSSGNPQKTHFVYKEEIPNVDALITTIKMAQITALLENSYVSFKSFPYGQDRVNVIHDDLSVFPQYRRHTIYIILQAPHIPFDMVMVDLPGILSFGRDVGKVKALVLPYLNDEGNIIILTLPVASDESSHSALNLVKEADPDFCRTIALLTKPDMLDRRVKRWLDMLDGKAARAYPFFCTYYSPETLSFTPQEAHLNELAFFDSADPWTMLENRHCLGANAVVWAAKHLHEDFSRGRNRSEDIAALAFEYRTNDHLNRARKSYSEIVEGIQGLFLLAGVLYILATWLVPKIL